LIVFLHVFRPNYEYLNACGNHILKLYDVWNRDTYPEINFTLNRVMKMVIKKISETQADEENERTKIKYKIKYMPPFY
jgi:hypothetical protein